MEEARLTSVLAQKLSDLQELERLTMKQAELIKQKGMPGMDGIDSRKKELLRAVMEADSGLIREGARIGSSEKAAATAKKINSLITNLIKLEKENERMISMASMALSGSHINAYKTYKTGK